MRVGASGVNRGSGVSSRAGAYLFFLVLLALTAGNLHANVILGLGIPTCTAVDSPNGTVTPSSGPAPCGATDSQVPEFNGLAGVGFQLTGFPLAISDNNDNTQFRTTTMTFSTGGFQPASCTTGCPSTIAAGLSIATTFHFNFTATHSGGNSLLDDYTVTLDIFDQDAGGASVFTGPGSSPATFSQTFVGGTNLPNGTGNIDSAFSGVTGLAFDSTHHYNVLITLVIHWDQGTQNGLKNWFMNDAAVFVVNAVPEPATLGMGGAALVGLALLYRRKRSSN